MSISEIWDKSAAVPTSAVVQAISDARYGGPVQARHNRNGNEVLLLFTESGDVAVYV